MNKFNDFFSKYIKIDSYEQENFSNLYVYSLNFDNFLNKLTVKLKGNFGEKKIIEELLLKNEIKIKQKFNLNFVKILFLPEENLEENNILEKDAKSNIVHLRDGDFLIPKPCLDSKKKIFGEIQNEDLILISEIKENKVCSFWGKIFDIKLNEAKNFSVYNIKITDYNSSIIAKMFKDDFNSANFRLISNLKIGQGILVKGKAIFGKFENEIIINNILAISLAENYETNDNHNTKRIELHLHTSMSSMDGITHVSKYIERAHKWGHKAIAITDHGVLQSFPDAIKALSNIKKNDANSKFKLIYGIESYFVNDIDEVNIDAKDINVFSRYVCFDFETTGLNASFDYIIEIGAVRVTNVENFVLEKEHYLDIKKNSFSNENIKKNTFNLFVKSSKRISEKITELTGITNEMIENGEEESNAIKKFIDFCGENPILVAHNATFDLSFLESAIKRHNINFNYKSIDSIAFCKSQITTIKNYKLATIASYFDLKKDDFNKVEFHRASDDALVLAFIFLMLIKNALYNSLSIEEIKSITSENPKKLSDFFTKIDIKKEFTYHQTLLVKNKIGLKNLYKLVSNSHLKYFYKKPRIPKSELKEYREGLLVGSACEASDFFKLIVSGASFEKLKETAQFYDYLEIQPIANNMFMVKEGVVQNEEVLKEFNRKIVDLGKSLNILVVATGDVHFLEPWDYKFREALMQAQNYKSGLDTPLYLRNTEEMLKEFSYLGEELAYEVVVTNPNKIADMIDDILPIPKGVYPPQIAGAQEELIKIATENSHERYGENLPIIIKERLQKELDSITKHGYAVLYIVAKKLVDRSQESGFLVGSRGSVGSSFVANIIGVSEVNPLKPHYFCKNCKNSEFITDNSFLSGFDLPEKKCPICNEIYLKDGHDIPFETFLGFDGDKTPDIDLNFSGEYQLRAHKHTEEIFGKNNVFKAGTISTIAEKSAIGFIKKNVKDLNLEISQTEQHRLALGITGIKRTTGQHPGGMIVVPPEMEIYDFCPIQRPANDIESNSITTHFDFHSIHDTICKLDELGHDVPTQYKYLEEYTGISVKSVNMSDPKVYSLFTSTKSLGISSRDINSKVGTFSLPEVGTFFVRQMLVEAQPKTFSDLIQISGLSHGTCVWADNARELIKNKICTIKEVIGTRDDIMVYLTSKGVDKKSAFKIMEIVRKGMASEKFDDEIMNILEKQKIPSWYIESCKKIRYMFPKAHATAYMIATIRLGWYKIYYPLEYYAAYFSAHGEEVDSNIAASGIEAVRDKLKQIENKGTDASIKEKSSISTLQVLIEAYCRKVEFLPVDVYKSEIKKFVIEDKKIRLPLLSFSGLGESAANNIYETRKIGKFLSMEDLRHRAKISKTVTDLMKSLKILNLQESDQISFF